MSGRGSVVRTCMSRAVVAGSSTTCQVCLAVGTASALDEGMPPQRGVLMRQGGAASWTIAECSAAGVILAGAQRPAARVR